MRRLAAELGVTQPVIYSAFSGGRQALVDAVAVAGFEAIAAALLSVPAEPRARMQAYLDFAREQPRVYEAMFSMPSGIQFGTGTGPEALRRSFGAIREAFPGPDVTRAEVAWATLHGLATLELTERLPLTRSKARVDYTHRVLTRRP